MRLAARYAVTLIVSLIGVGAFLLLGLPLPFLIGPMLACLAAAFLKTPLSDLRSLSAAARAVLGVAIGSSVTPEVVAKMPLMAVSVAMIPLYIAAIALIGVPFFTRVCGFDRPTAFFSAMPGGAADMTLFGQEAGANIRQVSLVHATRLLVLVMVTPAILVGVYAADLSGAIGAPVRDMDVLELVLMLLAATVGSKVAVALRLFGGVMVGPMILTIGLSLCGLINERPPLEALLAAQFFIGIGIGVSYVGITLTELRQTVLAAVAYVVILAVIAALVTEAVVLLDLAPPVEAFLSFAPGGQAEMAMLAIVTGADVGFVVVHHLVRVLLVIVVSPFFARFGSGVES